MTITVLRVVERVNQRSGFADRLRVSRWHETSRLIMNRQRVLLRVLIRAIEANTVSCFRGVRYGGADPKLLLRLQDEGLASVCDHLEDPDDGRRRTGMPLPSSGHLHPLWDRELDG